MYCEMITKISLVRMIPLVLVLLRFLEGAEINIVCYPLCVIGIPRPRLLHEAIGTTLGKKIFYKIYKLVHKSIYF